MCNLSVSLRFHHLLYHSEKANPLTRLVFFIEKYRERLNSSAIENTASNWLSGVYVPEFTEHMVCGNEFQRQKKLAHAVIVMSCILRSYVLKDGN